MFWGYEYFLYPAKGAFPAQPTPFMSRTQSRPAHAEEGPSQADFSAGLAVKVLRVFDVLKTGSATVRKG